MYVSKVILTTVFLGTSYVEYMDTQEVRLSNITGYLQCKTLGCWILAHLLLSIRLLSTVDGIVWLCNCFPLLLLHGIDFLGIYYFVATL